METSFSEKRKATILDMLEKNENLSVIELSRTFQVSPVTIRRDLELLEQQGIIERFYGGAKIKGASGEDSLSNNKLILQKEAIAQNAAKMVSDGDTLFINTSSTAIRILNYITASHVTVITNNAKALQAKLIANDLSIVLTGGELRFPKNSMTGEFALNNLNKVTVDKCFLGCAGITVEEGLTTNILQEASINETMLRRTNGTRVIVADHTKIGLHQNFISGNPDLFDYLITDTGVDDKEIAKFQARGITCVQVPVGKANLQK
ncbi:DeoR/GlpR family DNA-binding transcription regulator [uncultured Sphaerochaeta sp.]|uniref:DeoR/GlpR family DNA-binding transcription regulator n=1 Tax=uncultured Sphaerochaeta sp. TaxID=886478 RepID=UPI002A0A9923|nr:DeoR/GlpR family DNA-binding transcription regulator [uncultured Sphaerochaeta sp.]